MFDMIRRHKATFLVGVFVVLLTLQYTIRIFLFVLGAILVIGSLSLLRLFFKKKYGEKNE